MRPACLPVCRRGANQRPRLMIYTYGNDATTTHAKISSKEGVAPTSSGSKGISSPFLHASERGLDVMLMLSSWELRGDEAAAARMEARSTACKGARGRGT